MLFQILKAMGFDVPAHINALKADIDQRVAATTSQVSQVAQQAAVLAALYAFAAGAALLAIAVALIAVFYWVSDYYGVYAGLGVIFLILLAAAAIPAIMAQGRSRALAVSAAATPRALLGLSGTIYGAAPVSSSPSPSPAPAPSPAPLPVASAPVAQSPSAGDLVEPLAALLTGAQGRGSIAAEILAGLGGGGGPVNMALDRATNVVRAGDRSNLLAVLGSAAVLGFLVARSRPRRG